MSRGFVKEGDQEEIPIVTPRAFLPEGVTNYVTSEGLALLRSEKADLMKQYETSKNDHLMRNFICEKMALLQERINSAVEVDASAAAEGVVSFGMYVKYNDRTIRIVGVDEADFTKGLIAFTSPIAKALTGHKRGDSFLMTVPKGTEQITIVEVSSSPLPLSSNTPTIKTAGNSTGKAPDHSVENNSQADTEPVPVKSVGNPTLKTFDHSDEKNGPADTEAIPDKTASNSSLKKEFVVEASKMDFLPLVNERGNFTGKGMYYEMHGGSRLLHPSVHLRVNGTDGKVRGLYWWHILFGETAEKTLERQMSQYVGLSNLTVKMKRRYVRETIDERELVYVFTAESDGEIAAYPKDEKKYLKVFEKD